MQRVGTIGFLALALAACGDDPGTPLVDLRDATETECEYGGTATRIGFDDNGDGGLDDDEVTDEIVTCNGPPGRGEIVDVETVEPGGVCSAGGVRIRSGLDSNRDEVLQAREVGGEAVVCRGEPGPPSLIRTSPDGSLCASGEGIVVESGLDDDRDGVLDDDEVTRSRPVCRGEDAPETRVVTRSVAPGDPCPRGGRRIDAGVDDDGDGVLNPSEVDASTHLCDPADNLVDLEVEGASTSTVCPESGGTRIESGLDDDGDGELSRDEVDRLAFVCNGLDGTVPLVLLVPEPAGANCASGGQKVEVGDDLDRDGALAPAEVTSTAYVCNGQPAGPGGAVRTTSLAPGPDCVAGGVRIETGPDGDGDGVLDDAEVTDSQLVCNGSAELSAVALTEEPPGANCAEGGVRIESGKDTDGDGTLDPNEVDQTEYLCDANANVPFVIRTDELPSGIEGLVYRTKLEAVGGSGGSYAWSLDGGALPPGMRLVSASPHAVLEGSPSATGTFTFTVKVTDFFGQSTTATYDLKVMRDLAIETTVLEPIEVGSAYSETLRATSPVDTWTVVGGSLPPGLSLDAQTGVVSGTPTEPFGRGFLVEAETAGGATDRSRVLVPGVTRWGAYVLRDDNGPNELYAFSAGQVTPGTPVAISPSPASGSIGVLDQFATTDWFEWSSRGRLAFPGQFTANGATELYAADLTGSTAQTAVRVHAAYPPGREVKSYAWATDADVLAYTADQDANDVVELYVVRFTGTGPGTPVKVNTPTTGNFGNVRRFALSPDGEQIAFIGDLTTAGVDSVYLSDTRNPSQSPVSPAFLASASNLAWSSDSRWLAFNATRPGLSGQTALHLVDTSSSTLPRTEFENAGDFLFAPTADRIVFVPRSSSDGIFTVELSSGVPGPVIDAEAGGPIDFGVFFDDNGRNWNAGGDLLLIFGNDARRPNSGNEPYLYRADGGSREATLLSPTVVGTSGTFVADGRAFLSFDSLYPLDDLLNPVPVETPFFAGWRALAYLSPTSFELWAASRTSTTVRFAGSLVTLPRRAEQIEIAHEGEVGVLVVDLDSSFDRELAGYFVDVFGRSATEIDPNRPAGTDFRSLRLEAPWVLR